MARLHISQDETSFWQLTFEDDDGTLTLISHQFTSPDHLIQDARELVDSGKAPGAVIIIAPPQAQTAREQVSATKKKYEKPAPRRADR